MIYHKAIFIYIIVCLGEIVSIFIYKCNIVVIVVYLGEIPGEIIFFGRFIIRVNDFMNSLDKRKFNDLYDPLHSAVVHSKIEMNENLKYCYAKMIYWVYVLFKMSCRLG